jgi:N-sulfoglucosamine sulfohydrolase
LAHATHNAFSFRNVQSIPRVLKKAGYRSAVVGKLHVQPKEVYPFDEEITQNLGGNRNVQAMADAARKFITEGGDKPFFLLVGFADPHRAVKGFGNETRFPKVPEQKYDPKEIVLPYHLPDHPEVRQDLAEYYQSTSRMDHGVGLIRKVLEETKKDTSTLVIFLSDNGIPFPGAKTTLYDAGVHLPLILSSPSQKNRGVVSDALVSWTDIAPTVLAWAGQKAPPAMSGRSLLPLLEGEKSKGWDVVYGSHQYHEVTMYYPIRMIRTRTHKYILNLAHQLPAPTAADLYDSPTWQGILKRGEKMLGLRSREAFEHRPKEELYDLTSDPNELKNLVSDPASEKVLADLRARLKEWQKKTQDPWLVKYEHE